MGVSTIHSPDSVAIWENTASVHKSVRAIPLVEKVPFPPLVLEVDTKARLIVSQPAFKPLPLVNH